MGSSHCECWIGSVRRRCACHQVCRRIGPMCMVSNLSRTSFAAGCHHARMIGACPWANDSTLCLSLTRQMNDIRDASDWRDRMASAGTGSGIEAYNSLVRGRVTWHSVPSRQIPDLSHVGLFGPLLCGHKAVTPSCHPFRCTCFLKVTASPPRLAACHACPSKTIPLCTCGQRGRGGALVCRISRGSLDTNAHQPR